MNDSCFLRAVAAGTGSGSEKVESIVKSEPARGRPDVSEEDIVSEISILFASSSEYMHGTTPDSSEAPEEV